MEHALGVARYADVISAENVLILIVMEHALGDCSHHNTHRTMSLNPYCNGTCSRRTKKQKALWRICVLILIVMEHALGVLFV